MFYADLYGASYEGSTKNGQSCAITIPALGSLPALLGLRKDYAYGEQEDYFDDPHCIGWVRRGVAERKKSGCAVVLSNAGRACKAMYIGTAGEKFYDYLGNHSEWVMVDNRGMGGFPVEAGSVSVWVMQE